MGIYLHIKKKKYSLIFHTKQGARKAGLSTHKLSLFKETLAMSKARHKSNRFFQTVHMLNWKNAYALLKVCTHISFGVSAICIATGQF